MSVPPRVSIVIPAYNAARFIERTLETVAAQTWRDFELIVVDDGSADDTHGIAERFLRSSGLRGRAIRQGNKMIAGARNTGVATAQGEFVSFLDADDLWLPGKLSAVMEEFSRHPDADLVCHDEEIVKDGRVVRVARHGPPAPDMYDRLLFEGNDLSTSAVTVRRAKILEVGGFREDPGFNTVEDYDLWMRLAKVCRFRFLNKVLGRYQLIESSASNKAIYHHANLERLLEDHFQHIEAGLTSRLRKRKRLGQVYRSLARALRAQRDGQAARYGLKAALCCPWDPKNLAVAALCAPAICYNTTKSA